MRSTCGRAKHLRKHDNLEWHLNSPSKRVRETPLEGEGVTVTKVREYGREVNDTYIIKGIMRSQKERTPQKIKEDLRKAKEL